MVLYYSAHRRWREWESLRGSRPWSVPFLPQSPHWVYEGHREMGDGPMGGVTLIPALPLCAWDPRSPNYSPSKLARVGSIVGP